MILENLILSGCIGALSSALILYPREPIYPIPIRVKEAARRSRSLMRAKYGNLMDCFRLPNYKPDYSYRDKEDAFDAFEAMRVSGILVDCKTISRGDLRALYRLNHSAYEHISERLKNQSEILGGSTGLNWSAMELGYHGL